MQIFKSEDFMGLDSFNRIYSIAKDLCLNNEPVEGRQLNLENFDLINSQALYVINYELHKMTFHKGINTFLGYDRFDIDIMHSIIHPDDVDLVARVTHSIVKIGVSEGVGIEDRLHVSFRILDALGNYIPVERTSGIYETRQGGKVVSTFSILRKEELNIPFKGVRYRWNSSTISNEQFKEILGLNQNAQLSRREKEVLKMVAQGFKNQFIASKLHVSVETVRSHKKNMMRKLLCTDTNELVLYYHTYLS